MKREGYIIDPNSNCYYINDSKRIDKLDLYHYIITIDYDNLYCLKPKEINYNKIISLDWPVLKSIYKEVDTFMVSKEKYTTLNFEHRRGLIISGELGVGKTTWVALVAKHCMDKHDGIVIECPIWNPQIKHIITEIRKMESDRLMILVFDDLDTVLGDANASINKEFLDFLDSSNNINNILFLATTGNIKEIPDSVKKRPSRFDLIFNINNPTKLERKKYLKLIIPKDKKLSDGELDQWVSDTHGFLLSHLKELVLGVIMYDKSYKEMLDTINIIKNNSKEIGF